MIQLIGLFRPTRNFQASVLELAENSAGQWRSRSRFGRPWVIHWPNNVTTHSETLIATCPTSCVNILWHQNEKEVGSPIKVIHSGPENSVFKFCSWGRLSAAHLRCFTNLTWPIQAIKNSTNELMSCNRCVRQRCAVHAGRPRSRIVKYCTKTSCKYNAGFKSCQKNDHIYEMNAS